MTIAREKTEKILMKGVVSRNHSFQVTVADTTISGIDQLAYLGMRMGGKTLELLPTSISSKINLIRL